MSYFSYMTNHYQHSRNDLANSLNLWRALNPTDLRNHRYNLRPHKMKGGIKFLEIILFIGPYKSSELNDIILLYALRHIAFTMITLKAANCSTLCNTNIGSLVWETADFLEAYSGFITDCVLMNVDYKNFSDMDSKLLTECIKEGKFTLVLKLIIFTESFKHLTLYRTLYFYM